MNTMRTIVDYAIGLTIALMVVLTLVYLAGGLFGMAW